VRLYAAVTSTERIQLHQVHKSTGERVRYQTVVPDHGAVERDGIAKGYEYEKDRYVTLENDELKELKVETRHTIDLVQFVENQQIDPIYFDKPYFVAPDGELAEEAFIVVRDALRQTKKVALGQITLAGKERIAAIKPCGRGLLLETLRYEDEVRNANLYFEGLEDGEIDEDQMRLAVQLIDNKTAPFDPTKFRDHYQEALKELIAAKLEERKPELEDEKRPRGAKVINLMDALKRSVAQSDNPDGAKRAKRGSGKSKRPSAAKSGRESESAAKGARRRKSA
jgi:DNA end-binding protein Ku